MHEVTTDLVGQACALFLRLAYPAGEQTIPLRRRLFAHLPPGQSFANFLRQHPEVQGLCQTLLDQQGQPVGYALRLGSAHFPHLKLRMQCVPQDHPTAWVFSVDTHDAFSPEQWEAPADHPDAVAWRQLQETNRRLKEQIEHAWEKAGLLTFAALLRRELTQDSP